MPQLLPSIVPPLQPVVDEAGCLLQVQGTLQAACCGAVQQHAAGDGLLGCCADQVGDDCLQIVIMGSRQAGKSCEQHLDAERTGRS